MKRFLVVVDYQVDFVCGALGFPGAELYERPLLAAIEETLGAGGFVLFTRDTHPAEYAKTREGQYLLVPHCIEGTEGHGLYGGLHRFETAPSSSRRELKHTRLLDKPTFGSPDIGVAAKSLCGGDPDEITLCGLVTDICVLANAILLHSFFPGAVIRVPSDLTDSGNARNAADALRLLSGMGIDTSPHAPGGAN